MNGTAAWLELGTLALAVAILALDLIVLPQRSDPRRGALFALAAAGLAGLLVYSFRLPTPLRLTDAFVLDGFALFAKRILLGRRLSRGRRDVPVCATARDRRPLRRDARAALVRDRRRDGTLLCARVPDALRRIRAAVAATLRAGGTREGAEDGLGGRDQDLPVRERLVRRAAAGHRVSLRGDRDDVLDARDALARRSAGRPWGPRCCSRGSASRSRSSPSRSGCPTPTRPRRRRSSRSSPSLRRPRRSRRCSGWSSRCSTRRASP